MELLFNLMNGSNHKFGIGKKNGNEIKTQTLDIFKLENVLQT